MEIMPEVTNPQIVGDPLNPQADPFGGQLSVPAPIPAPLMGPEKQGIGGNFIDIVTNNSAASFLKAQHDQIYNQPNPTFNLQQYLNENPDRKDYAHIFADAENPIYADLRWERFKETRDANQRVAESESFWSNMAISTLTDPINAIPGLSLRRGVGIIEGAIRGGGSALPSIVVDQLIKSKYDPTFTMDDAKHELMYGTLMFGALGGAVGMLRPDRGVSALAKEMASEARRLSGDAPNPAKPPDPLNPDQSPVVLHSVPHTDKNGSYVGYEAKPTVDPTTGEAMPTGFAKAWFGFEKLAALQSPFSRIVNSGYRAMEDLAQRAASDFGSMSARNELGFATEPSAFLASEGWRAKAGDATAQLRQIHAAYLTDGLESAEIAGINVRSTLAGIADTGRRVVGAARPDGKMRFDQFLDEVFKAHKADRLTHENKYILEAANAIRPFFDDILGAQVRSGYIKNADWAYRSKANLIVERLQVLGEISAIEKKGINATANELALLRHQKEHIDKLDTELNDYEEILSQAQSNPTFSFKTANGKTYTVNADGTTTVPTEGGPQKTTLSIREYTTNDGTKTNYFFNNGRWTAVVEINGTPTLFYLSTGSGGKATVAKGQWYPFFGHGPETDWFNKGTEKQINDFYGSLELKNAANLLNKQLGDVRKLGSMDINSNDKWHPFIQDNWNKEKAVDPSKYKDVFDLYNPTDNNLTDPVLIAQFEKNIQNTVDRIKTKESVAGTSQSQKTIYLAYPYNELIASFPKKGARLVVSDNGTLTLLTKKEGRWVTDPSQRKIPYSTTPEVGMVPIELSGKKTETGAAMGGKFEGYNKASIGDKISELGPVEQNFTKVTGPEKFYLPRIFIPEQVLAKEAELRKMMTDWYMNPENNPNGVPMLEKVKERVNVEIDAMLQKTAAGQRSAEGGIDRAFFTRQRTNEIPNEFYAELGVIDTDLAHILQMYAHRAGVGIEYSRAFGSPDAELSLSRALSYVARESKGKTAEAIAKEMENLRDEFRNLRDGMLGTAFNNADAIGIREAGIIKAWFTLTSMGRAIFSSLGEVVRPMWVLGVKENFGFMLNALGNTDILKKGLAEQRQMAADYWELAMGQTFRLHMEGGVEAGFSMNKYNRALDTIGKPMGYLARTPEYVMNGVGILTHVQKTYTGLVASHILVRNIKNVAEGINTPKELEFLASYGISAEDAKLMAKMPIESERGINFANTAQWEDRDLARKFYNSVTGIQRRVINSVGPADKPAVMMGILGKGADRKDAALLSMPFQLRSWGMGATNKIMLSGLQGRDASFMSGTMMMLGASYLMLDLKTPDKVWEKMGMDERILSSLEHSGMFAWYGDVNKALESLSGDQYGIRPALGMQPKFKNPNDELAFAGEFLGAGPNKMFNAYRSLTTGTDREQARAIITAIPFHDMLWIPKTFKNFAQERVEGLMR